MFLSPILPGTRSSAALDAGRCTVQILTLLANDLLANNLIWLVVSTPLKNISQLGLLFPIYGKNTKIQTSPPF